MTTYETMSLSELKLAAKDHRPKIKHYYIKSKAELIELLSMDDDEFPEIMRLEKITIHELRDEARQRGYINIWNLRRAELIELLYPSTKQNDENDDSGKKHNNPKNA